MPRVLEWFPVLKHLDEFILLNQKLNKAEMDERKRKRVARSKHVERQHPQKRDSEGTARESSAVAEPTGTDDELVSSCCIRSIPWTLD